MQKKKEKRKKEKKKERVNLDINVWLVQKFKKGGGVEQRERE